MYQTTSIHFHLLLLFTTTVTITPNQSIMYTVHGTNGIVIQVKCNNNSYVSNKENIPPGILSVSLQSAKRRSFKPLLQEVEPFIKPKKRPNLKPIQNIERKSINQMAGFQNTKIFVGVFDIKTLIIKIFLHEKVFFMKYH